MVQTALIFALGFLTAAFLAAAAAPSIWQRAVTLTRKRIEASVPLTLNELQADKDQQRAEFALTTRKLEMNIKTSRDKLTAAQVEAARLETERQALVEERERLKEKIAEQDGALSQANEQLQQRSAALASLEARQAELVRMIEESTTTISVKELEINDLHIDADSKRIELATQLTEQERLAGAITEIQDAKASVEQNLRSAANQLRAAQETQRADKRRVAELEKKTDRLATQLSDREERLLRREKELERVKEQGKVLSGEHADLERRVAAAERQRAHLEMQNAGMSERMTKLASIAPQGSSGKSIKQPELKALENERDRLLDTIERLKGENALLQDESRRPVALLRPQASGNAILRDKIHDLAAQVVRMTAEQEGGASPIPGLLGKAEKPLAAAGARRQDLPVSLADRIRALEHAARRG